MGSETTKTIVILLLSLVFSLATFVYVTSLKFEIKKLEAKNLSLHIDNSNFKRESSSFRKVVNAQNKHINSLAVENKKAFQELEEWKAKPAKIKYKTITKIREIRSDDCKDIKTQLDNIRSIKFKQL